MTASIHVYTSRHRHPFIQDHDLVGTLQDLDWKQTIRNHETDRSHRLTRPRRTGLGTQAPQFSGLFRTPLRKLRRRCERLVAPSRIDVWPACTNPYEDAKYVGLRIGGCCVLPPSKQNKRPEEARGG